MIIDKNTVQKVAHLARLELKPEEVEPMMAEMNKILEWMKQLDKVDTSNVEPLIHMSQEINVLRDDEVKNMLKRERALANAPKHDGEHFQVPKVIE